MDRKKIVLTTEDLKAIARYERMFKELQPFDNIDEIVEVQGSYKMTLADFHTALKNALKEDPTADEFYDNWMYPLDELSTYLGLNIGDEDEYLNDEDAPREVRFLPLEEADVISDIWWPLIDIYEYGGTHISKIDEYHDCIEKIDRFYRNADKPLLEKEFNKFEKEWFIRAIGEGGPDENATETELSLCRAFIEELIPEDSVTALVAKGYACYGGNKLYACDWKASRDCMLKLLDLTDNATYANTLGYIYYYGRCNSGVPEYDKAYDMFTFGAANGIYESMFKLADMYRHGYGCRKSPRTARHLYHMVYNDCLDNYVDGQVGSFPDAALRMGNIYMKGIDMSVMPETAYEYYLQADLAARERAAVSDFFGDANVVNNVKQALEEARNAIDPDFWEEYVFEAYPWIIDELLEGRWKACISVENKTSKDLIVKVSRVETRGYYGLKPILLTYARVDYCAKVTGVELLAVNAESSFEPGAEPVIFNRVTFNMDNDHMEFYYDDRLLGWLKANGFRFYPPEKEAPHGEKYRFARIAFDNSGKTYDYICDDPGVEVGDKVIVMGYDGETDVEVKEIYSRYESELGMPIERYKKIIRKN